MRIVIFGAGGMALEMAAYIEQYNDARPSGLFEDRSHLELVGYIDPSKERDGELMKGYAIFNEIRAQMGVTGYLLSFGKPSVRRDVFNNEVARYPGIKPINFRHPMSVVDTGTLQMGTGNFICPFDVICPDIIIGNHNMFNTNVTIGENADIGSFNVFNSFSQISGRVKIGNECLIGAGVNILQDLSICDNVTIGSGAVVTKDITEPGTYVGIPARRIK
jgi:sugar O-acyltransferase (sialic acid O-acetyltransferase NeuD family)